MWELGNTWEGILKNVKDFKNKCCHYYIKPEDHFILRGNW